jgi:hypothetical protein
MLRFFFTFLLSFNVFVLLAEETVSTDLEQASEINQSSWAQWAQKASFRFHFDISPSLFFGLDRTLRLGTLGHVGVDFDHESWRFGYQQSHFLQKMIVDEQLKSLDDYSLFVSKHVLNWELYEISASLFLGLQSLKYWSSLGNFQMREISPLLGLSAKIVFPIEESFSFYHAIAFIGAQVSSFTWSLGMHFHF